MSSLFKKISVQKLFLIILCLMAVILICGSAFTNYATKGEPREALVAMQMLHSHDWVLPIDASGDMSYKPPLFHWLIALFSLPAGHITELSSRLPSAVALLLMITAIWHFARRSDTLPRSTSRAPLAVLLLFTSFEVFRAGVNCRVDMLLASLMTCAIICLARGGNYLRTTGLKWHALAVLSMSGATLTKGPVGILLPLAIWWLWSIVLNLRSGSSVHVLKLTLWAIALGLLSTIIPAMWYAAAYERGGARFLSLVMEENFGRMTGTMSYASHVKPFYYNFLMIASGLLPWTLLLTISLWGKPWEWMHRPRLGTHRAKIKARIPFRNLSSQELLCWIVVIVVTLFYTIPKSKRGVYLLPLYPFAAILIADYIIWYAQKYPKMLSITFRSIATAIVLYILVYTIAWPMIANGRSDRHVAREIEKLTGGSTPIYTYINSRMDRFYGVDFYLGGRLVSLLPSGQVTPMPNGGYTPEMIHMPDEENFFIVMTANDWSEQRDALFNKFNKAGLTLTEVWSSPNKTRDMHRRLILINAKKP